jgi:putative tryptophan/tyrosine transport system substrate-binding protein
VSQNATFANVADPVGQGFAASLARPGGNMTGFGAFEFSVGGKWVQGLKELAPSARQLGVIVNPETAPYYPNFFPSLRRLLSRPVLSRTSHQLRTLTKL